jgi:hypothetical protein
MVLDIREALASNPGINRTALSKLICERWGWRGATGQLKDIRCRALLRALDKSGEINLPAQVCPSRKPGRITPPKHLVCDTTPVTGLLGQFLPLKVEQVCGGAALAAFKSFLSQYHYLGFDRSIGENMKYMVCSKDTTPLACLLFGSAAWSCSSRDKFIGWNKVQRAENLRLITNNTRFLILPWVRVPHLASHVLALVSRRVSGDWLAKYGHPILALETFVETGRFKGTCYQAANWIRVGTTSGRGRDGGHNKPILPVKDVYVFPLQKKCKEKLQEKIKP